MSEATEHLCHFVVKFYSPAATTSLFGEEVLFKIYEVLAGLECK